MQQGLLQYELMVEMVLVYFTQRNYCSMRIAQRTWRDQQQRIDNGAKRISEGQFAQERFGIWAADPFR